MWRPRPRHLREPPATSADGHGAARAVGPQRPLYLAASAVLAFRVRGRPRRADRGRPRALAALSGSWLSVWPRAGAGPDPSTGRGRRRVFVARSRWRPSPSSSTCCGRRCSGTSDRQRLEPEHAARGTDLRGSVAAAVVLGVLLTARPDRACAHRAYGGGGRGSRMLAAHAGRGESRLPSSSRPWLRPRTFHSVCNTGYADLQGLLEPGTVIADARRTGRRSSAVPITRRRSARVPVHVDGRRRDAPQRRLPDPPLPAFSTRPRAARRRPFSRRRPGRRHPRARRAPAAPDRPARGVTRQTIRPPPRYRSLGQAV